MGKIYGQYPGYLEKERKLEKVNNYNEYELFFLLRNLHSLIFKVEHDDETIDITEWKYGVGYLEQLTTKFGVEMQKPEKGKIDLRTDSFWAWYNFWYNHFFNVLNEEEYDAFEKAYEKKQDVTAYLPKCRWNEQQVNENGIHK